MQDTLIAEIMREIDRHKNKEKLIVCFSTTARLSPPLRILPARTLLGYIILNYLISDRLSAEQLSRMVDGKAETILIDIEQKQPIDLWEIAAAWIKKSRLVAIKPNDATVEAAYLLLQNYFGERLAGKSFLIYGAGNIGSKLALRLAEAEAQVYLYSRNLEKAASVAGAFNAILPKYATGKVHPVKDLDGFNNNIDGLISFAAADKVISDVFIDLLAREAIVIDGGINNLTESFIKKTAGKNVFTVRLDVRLGFIYTVLSLLPDVKSFFQGIQGERHINGIRMVAGGIIGRKGDVVLDRIDSPCKVIGVANGTGGIFNETPREYRDKVSQVKKYITKGTGQ